MSYLGTSTLETWDGAAWTAVTADNFSSLITDIYSSDSGYSVIQPVPEPSTCAILGLGTACLLGFARGRKG